MAKTKKTEEPVKDAGIDPCWCRYPDKAMSFCTVTIDIGGSGWASNAEFTEQEEQNTKDLPALKKDRIRKAFLSAQVHIMDYLDG